VWANAWAHVLDAVREVEWYAIFTYEALVHYHDAVVRDLLEIVRSGMRRAGTARPPRTPRSERSAGSRRRRLEYHEGSASPLSYLVPKDTFILHWKRCLLQSGCRRQVERLTSDILPHFGYISVPEKGNVSEVSLSPYPGPVTVRREFGRVLYSSAPQRRAAADDPVRRAPPTADLIAKLTSFA